MSTVRSYRYRVVDVFTRQPLEGNSLAVFPDASGLDDATMQKIAKELNLSETTFVFPPTRPACAASVRIFTPARELAFAGHPTIGTSFVLLDEGMVLQERDGFVLEEEIGPVPIRVEKKDRPLIWLRTPPIREGRKFDRSAAANALGLDVADLLDLAPQWLSAGNPTIIVALRDKAAVDGARLQSQSSAAFPVADELPSCVFIFAPVEGGTFSRMFAPEYGIPEDPATGSSTGPLAAFMMQNGLISSSNGTRFISEQGAKMGRRSLLHVQICGDQGSLGIDVGGYVTPVAAATMRI